MAAGRSAQYRVVVHNTFVSVVEAASSEIGRGPSLRRVSDSFLCCPSAKWSSLLNSLDEGSTTAADSSDEGSSVDGEQRCCASDDVVSIDLSEGSSELESNLNATAVVPCADVNLMAKENERLTRQNVALLETMQRMQSCLQRSPAQLVASASSHCGAACTPGQGCGYGAIWSPMQVVHPEQMQISRHDLAGVRSYDSAPQTDGVSPIPESSDVERTTLLLRNLPDNYTRVMFIDLLEREGFGSAYSFLYVPIDFKTKAPLGYALLDFADPSMLRRFWSVFHGFSRWDAASNQACFVSWSEPNQGLAALVERHRDSAVMHSSVPEEYKPMLFKEGRRVPFPPPTKAIRAPRVRQCRPGGC